MRANQKIAESKLDSHTILSMVAIFGSRSASMKTALICQNYWIDRLVLSEKQRLQVVAQWQSQMASVAHLMRFHTSA